MRRYSAVIMVILLATAATPLTAAQKVPPETTTPHPATPPASQPPSPLNRGAAVPALDLDSLNARLKHTKAIGLWTKLALKNQVDDLLDEFRQHHAGKPMPMSQLRRSYDLLVMKVLSLLQDRDQQLAFDIFSSRERIWGLLADPKSFATL